MFSELSDPFPRLSEADIALLQSYGNRRPIRPEEYLFGQGDQTNDFFIMLSGAIEIIVRNECTDRVIARHGPGRFIGELSLVSGVRLFVSVMVVEGGEVVALSRDALRQVIATQPRLSDMILRAFIARRTLLLSSAAASLRWSGRTFSLETRRVREYVVRSRVPNEWLDSNEDASVQVLLQSSSVSPRRPIPR